MATRRLLKNLWLFPFVASGFIAFQNCGYVGPSDPKMYMSLAGYSDPPTYVELNSKIFESKCLSCHSSGTPNFFSYETLLATGSVVVLDPESSPLYQQSLSGEMPKGPPPLSAPDVKAIYDWIAAGAPTGIVPKSPPETPADFVALAISPTIVNLKWKKSSQVVDLIKIERSGSAAGPFATIAEFALSTNSYNDKTVDASNTYYYKILLGNAAGFSSSSSVVSVTTPGYPPSDPTALFATVISSTRVDLTWVDNASDEASFVIERWSSTTGVFAPVATLGANVRSYSNTGLTPATTYYYRVRAVNAGGNSGDSNMVNATTLPAAVAAPAAPSNLLATPMSSAQVNLAWTVNSATETGFRVERGTLATGPFTLIFTTGVAANSYSDAGLTANTAYHYRILATNAFGNSLSSNVVSVTTTALEAATPVAPSTLTATTNSPTQTNLNWEDASSNEIGFRLERGTAAAGPFTLIFTSNAGVTSYADVGRVASTVYFYRVRAYNGRGESANSAVASGTTFANEPNVPTALKATSVSPTQINLVWVDNSATETGFKIERATSIVGHFSTVVTTATNVTTYTNTDLSPATTYYYRVSAISVGTSSAYSAVASSMTFGTFAWLNTNVFARNCVSCHAGSVIKGKYDMSNYTSIGTRIKSGGAVESLLYRRMIDGSMPEASSDLPAGELNAVKTWIDSGAPNN